MRQSADGAPRGVAGGGAGVDVRVSSLGAGLSEAVAEYEACRAELEKKEQALQELQENLIGGG